MSEDFIHLLALAEALERIRRGNDYEIIPEDPEELKKKFPEFLRKYGRTGLQTVKEGMFFNAGLLAYIRSFRLDIPGMIGKRVEAQEYVQIGDVGCGTGRFLYETKALFGERVKVVGFDLALLPEHCSLDEFVEGDFEMIPLDHRFKEAFDFVFSRQAMRYFEDGFGLVYRKVRDMIKPESGLAVLDYREAMDQNGPFLDLGYVAHDGAVVVNGRNILQVRAHAPDDLLKYLKENGCRLRDGEE